MIVKVCGVRSPEIAEVALDAGADWIGIVFEPRSPRHASDAEGRAVRAAVGSRASVIGVFVEPSAQECDDAAQRYRLDGVQVHGAVSQELAVAASVPVIRGMNIEQLHDAVSFDWWPDCLVLMDAPPAVLPGGTGTAIPLALAALVAEHRPAILAGGLRPETVAEAVRTVRPRGVDASSGLETAPGVKDAALVHDFVRNAREAFATVITT